MGELRVPGILQPGIGLRGRVAGAGLGPARPAGPGGEARARGRGAPRVAHRALGHGRGLALGCALAALVFLGDAQAQVVSTRIWPARDYTRLTLESKAEIKYTLFGVKDPERLVLDLEIPDLPPALAELNGKVTADDPYIQGLRVGRNRPGDR